MTPEALHLDDISVAYRGQIALERVSGAFRPGSLTAIAGPNGAGKSTLLKAIMGEARLCGGAIRAGDRGREAIGYLPQAAEIDRQFPISVADAVMLGAWRRSGAFGGQSRRDAEQGCKALERVGLAGLERRPIGTLSAGQFQRVLFARLLLQDADTIILDEPFTAVDAATTRDLLAIVAEWHRDGRTVIAVLHDLEQIRAHFPETQLLARRLIHWGPTELAPSPANILRAHGLDETALQDAPRKGLAA